MDMGMVYAMVSAVKCVNLAIHRPVPLGLIIHYMFIKKFKNFKKEEKKRKAHSRPTESECSGMGDNIFI